MLEFAGWFVFDRMFNVVVVNNECWYLISMRLGHSRGECRKQQLQRGPEAGECDVMLVTCVCFSSQMEQLLAYLVYCVSVSSSYFLSIHVFSLSKQALHSSYSRYQSQIMLHSPTFQLGISPTDLPRPCKGQRDTAMDSPRRYRI